MNADPAVNPMPPRVRLHWHGAKHIPGNEAPLMVEARDDKGDTVGFRALTDMDAWLKANGYSYQTGSNGGWVR